MAARPEKERRRSSPPGPRPQVPGSPAAWCGAPLASGRPRDEDIRVSCVFAEQSSLDRPLGTSCPSVGWMTPPERIMALRA